MCSRWRAYSSRTGCGLKGFCARPQRRNASVPHALYSNNEQSHIRIQLSSSPAHTHTHTNIEPTLCYITKHMHKVLSVLHMHKCMMHRYMQEYNGRHQNENTSIHDPRQQEENTVTSWGCPNKLHNSSTRSTRLKTTSVPEQHQRGSRRTQTQPASSAAPNTLATTLERENNLFL